MSIFKLDKIKKYVYLTIKMKCHNDPTRYYTGKENTPLGRGYSASVEKIGTKKKGKDGRYYVVVNWGKGKRWSLVGSGEKKHMGSPRGDHGKTNIDDEFFDIDDEDISIPDPDQISDNLPGEMGIDDIPFEIDQEILLNMDCESLFKFRYTSDDNMEIVDDSIERYYEEVLRKHHRDHFPKIDWSKFSNNRDKAHKVMKLCGDYHYKKYFLNDPESKIYMEMDEEAPIEFQHGRQEDYIIVGKLIKAGVPIHKAFDIIMYKKPEQIDTILGLINEGMDYRVALEVVNYRFTPEQIDTMLKLKNKGLSDLEAFNETGMRFSKKNR